MANAYSKLGPISKFDDVFLSHSTPFDASTQLAAEQIVHLMDGWRYAASAIAAFLRNSPSETIHFAYYAELRAAMSLYSGSGVRLEQNDNYYVDSTGRKFSQQAGKNDKQLHTHTIAWSLWNAWISRTDAQDLVLDGLRIAPSISLRAMVPVLTLFSPSHTIGAWGYDLISQPKADRSERNNASYKALLASKPLIKMTDRDLEFVLALCRLLLPAQSGLKNSLAFDSALLQFLAITSIESKVPDNETNRKEKVLAAQIDFIKELSNATGQDKALINDLFQMPDVSTVEIFELASDVVVQT